MTGTWSFLFSSNPWAPFLLNAFTFLLSTSLFPGTLNQLNDDFHDCELGFSAAKVSRVSTFSYLWKIGLWTWIWWYSMLSVSNIISYLRSKGSAKFFIRFFTNTYIMINDAGFHALINRCRVHWVSKLNGNLIIIVVVKEIISPSSRIFFTTKLRSFFTT